MSDSRDVDNVSKRTETLPLGTFRYLLARALKERHLTANKYARRLKMKNAGFISLVLSGKRGIPLERVNDWLGALGVSDQEYATMYLRALDDYAPPMLLDLINEIDSAMRDYHESVVAALKRNGLTDVVVPSPRSVRQLLVDRSRQRSDPPAA